MAGASRRYRALPASLRLIRDFVRAQAIDAGLEHESDDLVLAASEAAGNAIVHASGDRVEILWHRRGDSVEIEVRDSGVFNRRPRVPNAEGGRGIQVMLALMDDVTIREGRPGRPGTVVRLRKRVGEPAYGWTV